MRHKVLKLGMLAGILAVLAAGAAYPHKLAQFYYVREMLAALLLFSIGFAVVAVVVLILFLLDRGLYRTSAWAGAYTAHAGLRLHQGWMQVEQFRRKQFHHSEQPLER